MVADTVKGASTGRARGKSWWLVLLALVVAFYLAGVGIASAVIVALLMVGAASLIRSLYCLHRGLDFPSGQPPKTRGMPLGWLAPVYDWYCPKLGLGPAFRDATLALAELEPGHHVLEVGCGTGVLTSRAAEIVGAGGSSVGIDPAPEMIILARRNARAGAEFRLGVIEALPFPDNAFDAVFASAMLHHLPRETKAAGLKEVLRVLKPGGRLVVADLDKPTNALWWLLFWPMLLWPMLADNLRGFIPALVAKAGFVSVERRGSWMGLLGFWTARKAPGDAGGKHG